MKRIILLVLASIGLIFAGSADEGFNLMKPDALGGQFVGTRQDASQIGGSGIGPGLSLFFRYNLSPRVMMDIGTGYAMATDDILSSKYEESILFPNLTVKSYFKLLKDAKLTPFFHLGLMSSRVARHEAVPNRPAFDHTFSELVFLFGSGFVYKSYFNFSFTLNADYRSAIVSSDDIKSKYWVVESGISFPMNRPKPDDEFDENLFFPQNENFLAAKEESAAETRNMIPNDEFLAFLYKIESLLDRIEDKQKQLEVLEARVIANERAIATVTGFVASEFVNYTHVDIAQNTGSEDQDYMALYQSALTNYNNKLYYQAVKQFERLILLNETHPLSSNCQYWIGECYHAQGDYANAAVAYNSVLNYTLSTKYDDALLMSGICQMELGNKIKAKEYFSELINQYPDSEYLSQAKNYISSL